MLRINKTKHYRGPDWIPESSHVLQTIASREAETGLARTDRLRSASEASIPGTAKFVIVKAGYLLRTADVLGETLKLTGDLNATTDFEVIAAPPNINPVAFNGKPVDTKRSGGRLTGSLVFNPPTSMPNLHNQRRHYIDSLPEVQANYNDQHWTVCNHTHTTNPRNLTTPFSLYGTDYGYHAGSLIYRDNSIANGSEKSLPFLTEGGYANGHSAWLNGTHLGSWPGISTEMFHNETLNFPHGCLQPGTSYVLTILIDHMGYDENFPANTSFMKDARGLLDYTLHGRAKAAISWKITGSLECEQDFDHSSGPLNDGASFAECQVYHLPGAPARQEFTASLAPTMIPIHKPGLGFWVTHFNLSLPADYDIPTSVSSLTPPFSRMASMHHLPDLRASAVCSSSTDGNLANM
ncbi:hypothetical protein N7493_006748 [Penicillium malachiteum]|uniref:Beta-galactosidase n=1 Tax=Penicillium malachiteum TaxID=1324776 RepID=A0AAD6HJG7_9EURO|nr:hypothetical protein N7493_006748 [Penicillium malachiteum]